MQTRTLIALALAVTAAGGGIAATSLAHGGAPAKPAAERGKPAAPPRHAGLIKADMTYGGGVVTVGGDPTNGAVTVVPGTDAGTSGDQGGGVVTIGGDAGGTTVVVPNPYGSAAEWGFGSANPANYDPQSPADDPDPIPTDYP